MKILRFNILRSIFVIILSIVTVITTVIFLQKVGRTDAYTVQKIAYDSQNISIMSFAK